MEPLEVGSPEKTADTVCRPSRTLSGVGRGWASTISSSTTSLTGTLSSGTVYDLKKDVILEFGGATGFFFFFGGSDMT